MKERKMILNGLLVIVILILFIFMIGLKISNSKGALKQSPQKAATLQTTGAADVNKNKASAAEELGKEKSATDSSLETQQQEELVFPTEFVQYDHPVALSNGNTAAFTKIIERNMQTIIPSPRSPVKYTVYIESLTSPAVKSYVSNWTPAEAQFSASIIKLYILITVFQQYQTGVLQPETLYELAEEDRVTGSGTMLYEANGTVYTLDQLCHLMISESDNIATNVLIDQVGGFEAINQVIKEIEGQENHSTMERKMMDTSNIENGKANRVNARQVVKTMLRLYQGEMVSPAADQAMLEIMLETKSRKKIPADLPKGAVVYNKTGESSYRGIENDLAIIEYQGEVFGICILTQMDRDGEVPQESIDEQTASQIAAIANLASEVTQWFGSHGQNIAQ